MKIYHLDEMEEFYGTDNWKLTIDVSDIWNQYKNNQKNIQQFNNEYIQRIIKYKNEINDLGNDKWNAINTILTQMNGKTDINELIPLYDSIYDWADTNDVLIKTK